MILELNQTYLSLSLSEAKSLFGEITELKKGLYKTKSETKPSQAGLVKKIYQEIKNYKIKGSFKIINTTRNEIEIHTHKFKEQGNKVSIKNPDNLITIKENMLLKQIWENKEKFKERKSHLRIKNKPIGIDPKIARALVNIAKSEEITDPFCGTGGILLEAALINKKVTGIDISKEMIDIATQEFEKRKLKVKLELKDSTKNIIKTQAIVTDIPYGKNSKTTNTQEDLINSILKNTTAQRAIICKKKTNQEYTPPNNWKLINRHEIYVHKSMTREVLELINTSINTF